MPNTNGKYRSQNTSIPTYDQETSDKSSAFTDASTPPSPDSGPGSKPSSPRASASSSNEPTPSARSGSHERQPATWSARSPSTDHTSTVAHASDGSSSIVTTEAPDLANGSWPPRWTIATSTASNKPCSGPSQASTPHEPSTNATPSRWPENKPATAGEPPSSSSCSCAPSNPRPPQQLGDPNPRLSYTRNRTATVPLVHRLPRRRRRCKQPNCRWASRNSPTDRSPIKCVERCEHCCDAKRIHVVDQQGDDHQRRERPTHAGNCAHLYLSGIVSP